MRDAAFDDGSSHAGPFSVTLEPRGRRAATFDSAREASLVALMAAGLVKATSGQIFVDEFDPRVQPAHVKRLVGYVPHELVGQEFENFARYVDYRATLWGVPRDRAAARAYAMLERLDGVHEAFAYPLVGALIASQKLLVLDRPQGAYAAQILEVAGADVAVFSTHVSAREARLFDERAAAEASHA